MAPHKKIETPELMWQYFEAYVIKVKGNPFLIKDWVGAAAKEVNREKEKPLTMVGFENYLNNEGIMADCSDYFESDAEGYKEYKPVCKRIKRVILQDHTEGSMCSIYHHGVTARLNGWTDKIENTNKNVPILNVDPLSDTTNNITP